MTENVLILICFILGILLFFVPASENFLDEENLEAEYAPMITRGGLDGSGTVFDARPPSQQFGMGWIN